MNRTSGALTYTNIVTSLALLRPYLNNIDAEEGKPADQENTHDDADGNARLVVGEARFSRRRFLLGSASVDRLCVVGAEESLLLGTVYLQLRHFSC